MSNNDVGFGKPPKHSRFKPGQSGNPKGRPKGRVPTTQLLEQLLNAKMTVMVGGKQKTMTRREALIIGFVGDALKGNDKVRKQVLDLLLILEAQTPPDALDMPSDALDVAVIKTHLQRHGVNSPAVAPKPSVKIKIIKTKTEKPAQ